MTGFIRGIFGSKKKKQDDSSSTQPDKNAPKESTAYFLDPDEAKTYGNIDYMRTAKSVKKTFPKGKVVGEYTKAVSAMETMDFTKSTTPQPVKRDSTASGSTQSMSSTPNTPTPSFNTNEATGQRKSDSSMDMFRNMAKDIKKR